MSTVSTLYLYMNKQSAALYVGITGRGTKRADEHWGRASWWDLVFSARFQHFPTRADALLAEEAAIKHLRPFFNVLHNDGLAFSREEYDRWAAMIPSRWEGTVRPDLVLLGTVEGRQAHVWITNLDSNDDAGLLRLLERAPHRLRVMGNACRGGTVYDTHVVIDLRDPVAAGQRTCVLTFARSNNGRLCNPRLEI